MARLDNGNISIEVADHGAELQSIKKNGKEYLWQGDSKFWGRRSPVLFPIVGRVWNDCYRHGDDSFAIGQHGFARDMDFNLISSTDEECLYELCSNDATRKVYPFEFRLLIGYKILGNSIIINWTVENTDTKPICFQIGAHPAFNLPDFNPDNDLRGFFRFDSEEALRYITPAEKGCVSPVEQTLQRGCDGNLPLRRNTFDCDTYIFQNSQLRRVELLTRDKYPYITVEFSAPLVARWAPTATKPDCPFVCIEPWYGRCDQVGYEGQFTDREWMQHLTPGEKFEASYSITIDD